MARNVEANQRMRDERRERIMASALTLFASKGLHGTKISHIARGSGSSQGLLYHYFDSKEDIYVALVESAFDKLHAAVRALDGVPLSPREKLRMALSGILEHIERNEDFLRYFVLMVQASASDSLPVRVRRTISRGLEESYSILTRVIAEGQRDGSLRRHDPRELAELLWAVVKGLALHALERKEAFIAPPVELVMGLFFRTA